MPGCSSGRKGWNDGSDVLASRARARPHGPCVRVQRSVEAPRRSHPTGGAERDLRPGVSTREQVRAALGPPWLVSGAFRFDALRVEDESRSIELVSLLTPPVPIAVIRATVGGYVLVTYDSSERVSAVAAGNAVSEDDRGLLLRADGVLMGVAAVEVPGAQLLAEAPALAGSVASRRGSLECTLVVACEPAASRRWPEEGCPDRVQVGDGPPFDTRGFFAWCEGADSTELAGARGFVRLPIARALSLAPGRHGSR